MKDSPISDCPECTGTLRRIFSGGSGFLIKNAGPESPVRPHCGKAQTCCGSSNPCETPSCESK